MNLYGIHEADEKTGNCKNSIKIIYNPLIIQAAYLRVCSALTIFLRVKLVALRTL